MMIALVDDGNAHPRAGKFQRGRESAEACAHDDDMMQVRPPRKGYRELSACPDPRSIYNSCREHPLSGRPLDANGQQLVRAGTVSGLNPSCPAVPPPPFKIT